MRTALPILLTALGASALAVAGSPIRITAGDIDAIVRVRVSPEYPPTLTDRIHGIVFLDCEVAADGSVRHVTILRGDAALAEPARVALLKWRFVPHRVNGMLEPFKTSIALYALPTGSSPEPALIPALQDPNPVVRDRAVYEAACGHRPSRDLRRALRAALGDPASLVRFTARRVQKECL
jgi:TonB family protein